MNPKEALHKLEKGPREAASCIVQMLKCERCGNYKTVGKRCKFCGSSTVEGQNRQNSEDLASMHRAASNLQSQQIGAVVNCNACGQWKHRELDFLHHDKICNDCYQEPGFANEGLKWKVGTHQPTLQRKPSEITKYKRPAGSSFRKRPSVTTFGYETWQQTVQLFIKLEERWITWGGKPIAFHDLLSRKKSHELVPTDLNPPPLCNACSDKPAKYGCPTGLLPLECTEQHFACEECFNLGFDNHKGFLGSKDREYNLTVLRSTFTQADASESGSLDFLEAIYFFWLVSHRMTHLSHMNRIIMGQVREAYNAYASSDGLDPATMLTMFKESFRVIPTNLEEIYQKHVPQGCKADLMRTIWVMYNVARPESPHLKHLNIDEKLASTTKVPDIEYTPPIEETPVIDIPTFVRSKCRILQMLGQGGMSVIWMVEYDGCKVAAKVPKAGIKARHKKEMFAAARMQSLIKHPNVLRVLGVHEDASWPCILLELAEGGDLTDWQLGKVDLRMQWKALMEVAQGMAAIHSCDPPLVHRDLKGQNVFLTKNGTAKVADFDFVVKAEPPHRTVKGICGTPGFMAPEMLAELSYGVKADVFSYGSLLYEITHKTFPFSKELEDRSSLTMEDWFELAGGFTLDGIRPKLDSRKTCPKMLDLITQCWDGNPHERPSMKEICSLMMDLRDEFINFSAKR